MHAEKPLRIPAYVWKKTKSWMHSESVWWSCSQPSLQGESREDADCKPEELLQRWHPTPCWCSSQELTSGSMHLVECKTRNPTRKTGVMILGFYCPNSPESQHYTISVLLSCFLKRRSRLQTGLILCVNTTAACGSQLSTPMINNLCRCFSALFCYYSSGRSSWAPVAGAQNHNHKVHTRPVVKQGIWMGALRTGWVTELYQV